jgi:hypothetical protein
MRSTSSIIAIQPMSPKKNQLLPEKGGMEPDARPDNTSADA